MQVLIFAIYFIFWVKIFSAKNWKTMQIIIYNSLINFSIVLKIYINDKTFLQTVSRIWGKKKLGCLTYLLNCCIVYFLNFFYWDNLFLKIVPCFSFTFLDGLEKINNKIISMKFKSKYYRFYSFSSYFFKNWLQNLL